MHVSSFRPTKYRPHHDEPAFGSIRSRGLRELEKIGKRKKLRAIFVRLAAPVVSDRMGMVLDLDL
jgi:hypothetical protein